MSDLTPPLAAKLAPFLARLASDSDAEVIACVRAIRGRLEARGFDLNDLAAMLTRSERVRIVEVAPEWEPETWGQLARWIVEHDGGRLQPHEREFASTMARRLVLGGEPSEKQAGWLRHLYDKLGSVE